MILQMQIGLAQLLREKGLTQKELAQAAGMRLATVNAIAQAQVERVELGTLTNLIRGLRALGVQADVGDILRVVELPDPQEQAAQERALRLLGGEPWGLKPIGLAQPVAVQGPAIEQLLTEHRGPEL